MIVARAVVVAGVTFGTGLAAVGIVLLAGIAILKGNGIVVSSLPVLTARG